MAPLTAARGQAAADAQPRQAAATVLADVRARMPREPILLTGRILLRWHNGRTERLFNVDAYLRFGEEPAVAEYTIRNLNGEPVERLVVRRSSNGTISCDYAAGTPLTPAALPGLSEPVRETHMTWLDLTLSFLWWNDATLVGKDKVKGYLCDVIDVRGPAEHDTAPAMFRLWIEEEYRVLLKAEERDESGKVLRRLQVKSFKKIGDEWMIRETVVRRFPEQRTTLFRILDVIRPSSTLEPPAPLDSEP